VKKTRYLACAFVLDLVVQTGIALGLFACATVPPASKLHARRVPPSAQGLALLYDTRMCTFTLSEEGTRRTTTWRTPDSAWEVQNQGYASTLLTAVALSPGRYRLTGYTSVVDWDELIAESGRLVGYTNCDRRSSRVHPVDIPFEISPGSVTLLAVPGSERASSDIGFDELTLTWVAMHDRYVKEAIAEWFPEIRRATDAIRKQLIVRQREPHDGYDVYPNCDRRVAVVRTTGKPMLAGKRYYPPYASAIGLGCVSQQAVPGGCLSDRREIPQAIEAAGKWLVEHDLRGEIVFSVCTEPENF
jgi:hypothetical protein